MKTQKTSADYQREYRKRLREQGLVKKEVWIHPDQARALSRVERLLRHPGVAAENASDAQLKQIEGSMNEHKAWNTHSLFEALAQIDLMASKQATMEMVEGAEAAIHIDLHEVGDLPVFITVVGEQILVECLLWPQQLVNDVAAFNDEVLATHKIFPLSTISLDTLPSGERYYTMFGALSAYSSLLDIVFEIEVLADNVIKATEAYAKFLPSHMIAEV